MDPVVWLLATGVLEMRWIRLIYPVGPNPVSMLSKTNADQTTEDERHSKSETNIVMKMEDDARNLAEGGHPFESCWRRARTIIDHLSSLIHLSEIPAKSTTSASRPMTSILQCGEAHINLEKGGVGRSGGRVMGLPFTVAYIDNQVRERRVPIMATRNIEVWG